MASIAYDPLSPPKGQIRLLTILPRFNKNNQRPPSIARPADPLDRKLTLTQDTVGANTDRIICKLRTVTLSDDPLYNALSYRRGDPKLRGVIEVDGMEVSVTSNLQKALLALRKDHDELTIWVDAISINQDDIPEGTLRWAS